MRSSVWLNYKGREWGGFGGERAVSSTRENSIGKKGGEAIGPRVEALSSSLAGCSPFLLPPHRETCEP